MAKKTWKEHIEASKPPQIKVIEKRFADMEEGCRMLIASPKIIKEYVDQIPFGSQVDMGTLRNDLAARFNADKSCPVTSGIFLKIVAESSIEDLNNGISKEAVSPFWRAVNMKMPLAKKLSCGKDFLLTLREEENLND